MLLQYAAWGRRARQHAALRSFCARENQHAAYRPVSRIVAGLV